MKILFVNDYEKHGGAEKFIAMLMEGLEKRGHKTKLHTPDTKYKTLDLTHYDVIHFNNICRIGLDLLKWCQDHNQPHIWTMHDYYLICKKRTRMMEHSNALCRFHDWRMCGQCKHELSNLPDPKEIAKVAIDTKIVATCNFMRNTFLRFGYNEDNMTVIKNGIQLDKYAPTWEDKGHLLWSGRTHFEKGWYVYLEAAKYLHEKADFLMTGGGTHEKISDFGKAQFLGYLSKEEHLKRLQSCRAFCLTSVWHEPCAYSQLEAQAVGKPIIGFLVGGLPEYIVDGTCGILTELDIVQYIDAVNYIIDNPDVAKKMGKFAHDWVQQFDINTTVDNYIKLYDEVIE